MSLLRKSSLAQTLIVAPLCSPRPQSPSPGLVAPSSIAVSLSGVASGIPNRDAINCSCTSHSASDAQSSPHQPTSPCFSLPCQRRLLRPTSVAGDPIYRRRSPLLPLPTSPIPSALRRS
ncbi:hypothetical protein M0R45_026375 [Rubus argutus]|uniref:Uncharacterized protein n=1 Tax=Rubus argutus TaxID=59490 RepID=A0AAW1WZ48_RUBAR